MATPPSEIAARKADLSAAKRALLQQRLQKKAAASGTNGIARLDRSQPLPLSHAQERLWFIDRLIADGQAYNVPVFLNVVGPLDVPALTKSLNAVVARHEALRTTFPERDGAPRMQIAPALEIAIPVHAATPEEAMALAEAQAAVPFDLAAGPLLRADLYRVSEQEHVLLLCMHHIVSDGWSMDVLREELVQGYRAALRGSDFGAPESPVQYADFAAAQRNADAQERIARAIDFWRDALQDAPPLLTLQAGTTRPSVQTLSGARQRFSLGAETAAELQALAASSGASAFMIALAAFNAIIARYTGQQDSVIGTPVSGRTHPAVQKLIGCFVNTIPIRTNVDCSESFRELVQRQRTTALDAMEHQDVPFERIVDAVNPERAMSYEPLCQVVFTCRENPVDAFELIEGTQVEVLETDKVPAKFDFVLTLKLRPDRIDGTADFNPDVYDPWFVEQFARHYANFLQAALASPNTPVLALPLMDEAEVRRITDTWNDSAVRISDERPVHEIVAEVAARYADEVAVHDAERTLSYEELNESADRIARALSALGAGPDTLVALHARRGVDAVIGALGILKAGAAFVPIDPAYPRERVQFMLEDLSPAVVLATDDIPGDFSESAVLTVRDALNQQPSPQPFATAASNNLAYAIYTSGTTGRPKAALLEHGGLTNLVHAQRALFDITPGMRVLQFAPPSFDAWVWEFIMALCNGATLCIPSDAERVGDGLAEYLRTRKVEAALLPPSVLHVLPHADRYPELRVLFSGGEACSPELANRWAQGRTFINAYGPTEATVVATAHTYTGPEPAIPIGRPIANMRAYVLDEAGRPLPPGCVGELHVGGAGVARGYLNRDDLTRERFVPDPFAESREARMYRTGDLVRWTPSGEIVYMGRADDQVKVRGFRIELGEIESAIRSIAGVQDCACTVQHAGTPDARVAAFVETNACSESETRERLREKLPPQMMPSTITLVDELPRLPNDKIDRRALAALATTPANSIESASPTTDTEQRVHDAWCEVLEADSIGIHDNFFDVGGHSLLAVKLSAALERQDVHLTVQQVFQSPTIARMAEAAASPEPVAVSEAAANSLVRIQPEGSGAPLFVIAPAGGIIFPYFHLSHLMGADRPIYGLQDPVVATRQKPFDSIGAYVDYYIEVVKSVQPHGPYYVMGWSLGGTVAYEMARAWEAAGEEVAFVGLIDTRIHALHARSPMGKLGNALRSVVIILDATIALWSMVSSGLFLMSLKMAEPAEEGRETWWTKLKRRWAQFWIRTTLGKSTLATTLTEDATLLQAATPTLVETLNVMRANGSIGKDFIPGPYGGKATLIRASERVRAEPEEPSPSYGWEQFAHEVEVHYSPGNHVELFSEPAVHHTAAAIKDAIARAEQSIQR